MECEVDNCCFYVHLRKGSLIIGYMSLCLYIALLIYGASASKNLIAKTKYENSMTFKLSQPMYTITMANVALCLIFTIILIIGLHMNKRLPILVYIVFMVISSVVTIGLLIWKTTMGAAAIDMCSFLLTICGTTYYCLTVVTSHYIRMKAHPISETESNVS